MTSTTAHSTKSSPLSLLSLSDAAASAHHIPVQHQQLPAPPAAAPIPIKQRRRSSFIQNRKRRPSDPRDPLMNSAEDRDRVTSSRLQMSLSLSPPSAPQGLVSNSAPLDGMKDELQPSTRKKGTIFRCESCAKVGLFLHFSGLLAYNTISHRRTGIPAASSNTDGSILLIGAKRVNSYCPSTSRSSFSRHVFVVLFFFFSSIS